MVICLERDADLHTAQLMPLPLIVSCSSKIQIGFTFLVPAHLGSPGKRAVKRACVRVVRPMTKRNCTGQNTAQWLCELCNPRVIIASVSYRYISTTDISRYTHSRLMALCPGLPGWAGTSKVKPIWILLKQETVSGSGISWAMCKSAPCSRQITTPVPHCSVFYRPDALPATQPTASKHWR